MLMSTSCLSSTVSGLRKSPIFFTSVFVSPIRDMEQH